VVFQYQRGLLFNRGLLKQVLNPGVYWTFSTRAITSIDMRLQPLNVPGQEILTSDGISLKISLAGEYQVVDPERYLVSSVNAGASLYLHAQQALRTATAEQTFEALLSARPALNLRVTELVSEQAAGLGLAVVRLEIRDLMLTGEIKRAFSDAVAAQKQGLAALERARSETASLRSLANAARIMQDHPALLQLRAIQAAEAGKGSTIVLGIPAETAIIPRG
jgi:regulator of protease activity HflC (stomatin/prohibitin superfamily)